MTHEEDVVTIALEALGLLVHLGNQGAGGIQGQLLALLRLIAYRRGDAVGREYEVSTLWGFGCLFNEDDSALGQRFNDITVVDDLLAHINGCAVFF